MKTYKELLKIFPKNQGLKFTADVAQDQSDVQSFYKAVGSLDVIVTYLNRIFLNHKETVIGIIFDIFNAVIMKCIPTYKCYLCFH